MTLIPSGRSAPNRSRGSVPVDIPLIISLNKAITMQLSCESVVALSVVVRLAVGFGGFKTCVEAAFWPGDRLSHSIG